MQGQYISNILKRTAAHPIRYWDKDIVILPACIVLHVDIPASAKINQSITANNVTDSHAGKVGQVYSFCIEDSTDEDYNDFT